MASQLTSAQPKINNNPRISLNKLGEYLEASAARRRAIVRDQKKPPGAIVVTRYKPVNAALSEYFEDPNVSFLDERIKQLKDAKLGTEWQRSDRELSADVLGRLKELLEPLDLAGVRIEPWPSGESASMLVAGVKVSVRPEFQVTRKSDDVLVGAIKLSHNKEHSLAKAGCEYVATVLWRYLHTLDEAQPNAKWCLSISSPTKLMVPTPKAYKAREASVVAACEEIAAVWPKV